MRRTKNKRLQVASEIENIQRKIKMENESENPDQEYLDHLKDKLKKLKERADKLLWE